MPVKVFHEILSLFGFESVEFISETIYYHYDFVKNMRANLKLMIQPNNQRLLLLLGLNHGQKKNVPTTTMTVESFPLTLDSRDPSSYSTPSGPLRPTVENSTSSNNNVNNRPEEQFEDLLDLDDSASLVSCDNNNSFNKTSTQEMISTVHQSFQDENIEDEDEAVLSPVVSPVPVVEKEYKTDPNDPHPLLVQQSESYDETVVPYWRPEISSIHWVYFPNPEEEIGQLRTQSVDNQDRTEIGAEKNITKQINGSFRMCTILNISPIVRYNRRLKKSESTLRITVFDGNEVKHLISCLVLFFFSYLYIQILITYYVGVQGFLRKSGEKSLSSKSQSFQSVTWM
jgi:hypothetical protein